MNKEQRVKYIASQILQFAAFYIGARKFWGNEIWYQDKLKEMIFFMIMSIAYAFIGILFYSFGAPLILNFTQINRQFQTSQTNFSIKGRKKTSEHERIVELKVEVRRKYSLWGKFIAMILRKVDFTIIVEGNEPGLNLIVKDGHAIPNLTQTPEGFEFKLNQYLDNILVNTSQCNVSKTFCYRISDDTINLSNGGEFIILPRIKDKNIWIKIIMLFTRMSFDEHKVYFVRS